MKKLSELKLGDIFTFAGFRWVKLEDSAEGTKVIAADKVEDQAFDTEDRNNWKESTLREYLNNDFLEYLYDEGAKPEDFLTIVSDLTADDGLRDYGISEDKIALITCDDYRKYRSLIPMIDGWWWTITPWSCNPSNSCYVRNVTAFGAMGSYYAYDGHFGVRPLIKLWQDTEVEVDEEVGVTDLKNLSLDDLAKQIYHWAVDRELNNADPKGQMLKHFEEAGELAEGIAKCRPDQVKDSIGDVYVVLTILALQLDLDIKECVEIAYNEIKNRKGKMVKGIYVKEGDLHDATSDS